MELEEPTKEEDLSRKEVEEPVIEKLEEEVEAVESSDDDSSSSSSSDGGGYLQDEEFRVK